MKRRLAYPLFVCLVAVSVRASVTQVDGTIVPRIGATTCTDVDNELQPCLDREEVLVGGTAGTLAAVRDADIVPEIFLPDLASVVTFKDISESAGFENSVGYYNVGDDVTSNANLHPILGCGVPASTHTGEAAGYVANAENGTTTTVNFQTEMTAGRYKGGYIAFYLITPQGNPSADNCGDFVNGSDGLSLRGRIYFTQKDLNNDGDFIHHLVYTSRANNRQFYFGFEDLFRGGDNDFDDMAIMVRGLTPPCLPTAELCNNRDDNCNTTVDDNPVDVGQSCSAGVGACQRTGVTVCATGGVPTCNAVPGAPTGEICNNIDDDCDGLIDDSPTDVGGSCSVGVGACLRTGVFQCTGGIRRCSVVPGDPTEDICDGLDNNCDGRTDEDFPVGMACEGVGQCGPGVIECAGPLTTRCSTDPGGSGDQSMPEVCNGLDDDCDGLIDEELTDLGPCGVTDVGACELGHLTCRMGAAVCVGAIGPSPEVCDGLDNDCNGMTDDMPIGVGQPCGSDVGECRPGAEACVGGLLVCQGGTPPADEKCDGLDNDCDGLIDNDPVDVGTPCGPVRPGECKQGRLVCVQGAPQCRGQIDPTPEICDGKDNDCDGNVDDDVPGAGTPCNVRPGVCTPGTLTCMGSLGLVCSGGTGGTPEVCNGLDDDCNGIIDDNVPGVGVDCGVTAGNCQAGKVFCVNGALECVGGRPPTTEVCDGVDNNCNGMIDEGNDICGGGLCINGQCASRCEPGEFPCPVSKRCKDDYCLPDPCYQVTCPAGADGTLNRCLEGACVTACSLVTCTGQDVCRRTDGRCVPNTCAFLPYLCESNQLCKNAECVANPCFGVSCPGGEFCRDGTCHQSCADVTCNGDEECRDGTCVKTGCDECRTGYVCDTTRDLCVPNMCTTPLSCAAQPGTVCEPTTGLCVVDPCIGVSCPAGEKCSLGQCVNQGQRVPVYATGGGGCSVGGGGGVGAIVLVLGVLLALRRRRVVPLLFLLSAGCKIDPYYLEFDGDGSPIGGPKIDARRGGDGGIVGGDGGGPVCIPGTVEICDGFDNNCDGQIDEGFDLDGDPLHCGACDVSCVRPGAQIICEQAQCKFIQCFAGSYDLNGNPLVDGCEYNCFPSNGGAEVCDNLDNDCNGRVDENVDKNTDIANCGMCGKVCKFFKVTNAVCAAGTCQFNPATDCEAGFVDADHLQETGCEYECTPRGPEICDTLDNDCDGIVDNGFENNTPDSCGVCGRQCVFPNVPSPRCEGGQCTFHPPGDCAANFHDANGNPLDGCEYFCVPSNGGKEICDGIDNDCDAEVDEASDVVVNDTRVGTTCGSSSVGECRLGQTVCSLGQIRCVGEIGPKSETCNGNDDDCDGTADNPNRLTDVGFICAPARGQCTFGLTACNGGVLSCVREVGPSPEICDGVDNDCNGMADDGVLPGVGMACGGGPMNGPPTTCVRGTTACANGSIQCTGGVGPTNETCDAMDNNCNGAVDEALGGGTLTQVCYGGPSGTAGQGRCRSGTRTCAGGAFSGPCVGEVLPTTESCNSMDDDCDGVADDGPGGGLITQACYDGPPGTSGVGPCHGGNRTCVGGAFGSCAGQVLPASEVCFNGVNDNCDASGGDQGCFAVSGGEFRADGTSGAGSTSAAGADHSFDVDIASSGNNVYVVFADNRQSDDKPQIFLARSTDGGVSYDNTLVQVTSDTVNAYTSPRVKAVGSVVVVAYTRISAQQSPRDMLVRVSTNNGQSFGTEKVLDSGANSDSFHFDLDAVQSGAVVKCAVAWEELDTASANLNRDVRVSRSVNCGVADPTFTAPQTANKGSSHIAGRPRVVFGNSDRIVTVWREQRSNMTFDIFTNRWDDASANINATDLRVDADPMPGQDDFPVAARNGGEIYLAWQEVKPSNANTDVVFVRSTDNGSTFGAEINIDDMGMLASYGSVGPQIAAVTVGSERRVYVTWQDTRQGTEIFASRSTNGGTTFEAVKRVSSVANPAPGVSREQRLAADAQNRVVVVYTSTRSGLRDIFLGYSIDGGQFWQPTDIRLDQGTAGSGTSVSPVVTLLSSGAVVTGWLDFRTGGVNGDIFVRRAIPQ